MLDIKIFARDIDREAQKQIDNLAAQPAFANSKIRIMPDCHPGKGCVIGLTATTTDSVIPNIVGVDIGCGVLTAELGNHPIDVKELDAVIQQRIPSGMDVHPKRLRAYPELKKMHCFRHLKDVKRIECSIGSLGGGNHFIEAAVDVDGNSYLVIHSGSRNLGKQVAEYYQNQAIKQMSPKVERHRQQKKIIAEYRAAGKEKELERAITVLNKKFNTLDVNTPKELCALTGEWKDRYLHDMQLCQFYAYTNRYAILNIIRENLKLKVKRQFHTVHNYIDVNDKIVRKGAVSARRGERLLIPINMRDGSLICLGRGNDDWNNSAPHGAGRLISRKAARETLSLDDFGDQMAGIYSTSVSTETLDEAPDAYKPMAEIVEMIQPTVTIERVLKPIYNYKAH